jgi:hypothetical protein
MLFNLLTLNVPPQRKEKDSCGDSTYTAGRSDAARKKNIVQTGMLMASCRHGVVLGAANMERGETYRPVHFLHRKLPSKFFCQDVVCHYWPFTHDVGLQLTQYSKLTSECSPFLSSWHGKTHSWPCQVIILPRFCKKKPGFTTFSIFPILLDPLVRSLEERSGSNPRRGTRTSLSYHVPLRKLYKTHE